MTEMAPENLTPAEELGLLVGAAYGTALAERDTARAVAEATAAHLTDLADAARAVLALDALQSLTWAHDEDTVQRLRTTLETVDSYQTDEKETPDGPNEEG